jgi:hypothetical protein
MRLAILFKITAVLFIFVSLFTACGPSRAELETQARTTITNDIVKTTNACFDQLTLGLGGLVSDMILTKSQKDSLILHPIAPYINSVLHKKSEPELKELVANRKERMKFILQTINNNRENISNYASEKITIAKEIIQVMTTLVEKYANQTEK